MSKLIIGSHVSFKKEDQLLGSVKEALSYGANTFMLYTGAPQNTNRQPINDSLTMEAIKLMEQNDININDVIVHAPYIINLANPDNAFAIDFLKQEISRVEKLHLTKLVIHPGSHVNTGIQNGLNQIVTALNTVGYNENVMILLETMAGKGSEVGNEFEQIKYIIDHVNYPIGVCLDTCHVNDAGYDLNTVLDNFEQIIGLNYLKCIHINDSKNEMGMRKDRHENFGLGYLGFDKLINLIYSIDVPKILETPYVTAENDSKDKMYPPYKFEIEMIKEKKMNDHLLEDIRNFYK